tara:strand:- start:5099 stop:7369 length:2271 start_codon:yes stop_codon:yes gene_type:complete
MKHKIISWIIIIILLATTIFAIEQWTGEDYAKVDNWNNVLINYYEKIDFNKVPVDKYSYINWYELTQRFPYKITEIAPEKINSIPLDEMVEMGTALSDDQIKALDENHFSGVTPKDIIIPKLEDEQLSYLNHNDILDNLDLLDGKYDYLSKDSLVIVLKQGLSDTITFDLENIVSDAKYYQETNIFQNGKCCLINLKTLPKDIKVTTLSNGRFEMGGFTFKGKVKFFENEMILKGDYISIEEINFHGSGEVIFDGQIVKGVSENVLGIKFSKPTSYEYYENYIHILEKTKITNLESEYKLTIISDNIDVSLPSNDVLNEGYLDYNNGQFLIQGDTTINNILINAQQDVDIYFGEDFDKDNHKNEDYVWYGNKKMILNGLGHKVTLKNGNKYVDFESFRVMKKKDPRYGKRINDLDYFTMRPVGGTITFDTTEDIPLTSIEGPGEIENSHWRFGSDGHNVFDSIISVTDRKIAERDAIGMKMKFETSTGTYEFDMIDNKRTPDVYKYGFGFTSQNILPAKNQQELRDRTLWWLKSPVLSKRVSDLDEGSEYACYVGDQVVCNSVGKISSELAGSTLNKDMVESYYDGSVKYQTSGGNNPNNPNFLQRNRNMVSYFKQKNLLFKPNDNNNPPKPGQMIFFDAYKYYPWQSVERGELTQEEAMTQVRKEGDFRSDYHSAVIASVNPDNSVKSVYMATGTYKTVDGKNIPYTGIWEVDLEDYVKFRKEGMGYSSTGRWYVVKGYADFPVDETIELASTIP